MEKFVVYAWKDKGGDRNRTNFGDELGWILTSLILNRIVNVTRDKLRTNKLFTIGSVIDAALPGDMIWGSGGRKQRKPSRGIIVRAVRGPLSRKFLMDNGIECPEIYGDPALLLPRYVQKPPCDEKIGFVPHIFDTTEETPAGVEKIDVTEEPLKVVSQIAAKKLIIARSLHGLIVADAYGVPAQLVGGGEADKLRFKYDDYLLSTGRPDVMFCPSVEEALKRDPLPAPKLPDLDALLAAFPRDIRIE